MAAMGHSKSYFRRYRAYQCKSSSGCLYSIECDLKYSSTNHPLTRSLHIYKMYVLVSLTNVWTEARSKKCCMVDNHYKESYMSHSNPLNFNHEVQGVRLCIQRSPQSYCRCHLVVIFGVPPLCLSFIFFTLINFRICDETVPLGGVLQHLLLFQLAELLGCTCGLPHMADKRFNLTPQQTQIMEISM